jgi:hypothetical protein
MRVVLRSLALALDRRDLGAKPVNLCPGALQLVLELHDAPLLLDQKRAAERELQLQLGLRAQRDGRLLRHLSRL